jgi:hypothetical protein
MSNDEIIEARIRCIMGHVFDLGYTHYCLDCNDEFADHEEGSEYCPTQGNI